MRKIILASLLISLAGCTGLPEGVQPVKGFDLNRYLGTWYEIARLDHSFERGLNNVTATYTLNKQGGIKVINRGYSKSDNEWKQAEGKAYFVRNKNEGYLKVSFFGPFYGTYAVFGLEKNNYQYAFISGNNKSYLWLMARTPTVKPAVIKQFIKKAKQLGFNTDNLIYVQHNQVSMVL